MNDTISSTVLATLRQFDTPTICNVIELFEIRPHTVGYVNKHVRAAFPELPPMVGFAATATCRAAIAPQAGISYTHLSEQAARFADLPGPPVVVFQDLDNPVIAATFGEVMCTIYRAFGAVGLVTNGGGRDLDQVRALDFPVFIDGAIASHGYIHILDLHEPVQVDGLVIRPDDLLHGDLNGITNIPREIAADVADAAAEFVAAEQVTLNALHAGALSVAELRAVLAETEAQIAALRDRVRRPQGRAD